MTDSHDHSGKAYRNASFMNSRSARPLRILAEYLQPEQRFEAFRISDTIVFFGFAVRCAGKLCFHERWPQ